MRNRIVNLLGYKKKEKSILEEIIKNLKTCCIEYQPNIDSVKLYTNETDPKPLLKFIDGDNPKNKNLITRLKERNYKNNYGCFIDIVYPIKNISNEPVYDFSYLSDLLKNIKIEQNPIIILRKSTTGKYIANIFTKD